MFMTVVTSFLIDLRPQRAIAQRLGGKQDRLLQRLLSLSGRAPSVSLSCSSPTSADTV